MIDPKALKAKLDIVAILRHRGLKLKRVGSSYKAPCIFHKDSHPSLSVNPTKRVWKCFGCGEGGDVFAFVMKQDGITFPEAVRKLCPDEVATAQDVGSPKKPAQEQQVSAKVEPAVDSPPQEPDPAAVGRPSQEVLDPVVGHWQKGLAETPKAQAYVKGRGLWSPELLKAFRVGYSSGNLTAVLPKDGKIRRQLAQIGILNRRDTEFLTNCLVFPIHDEAGVLVNVYGRSLDPDSKTPHLYLPGPLRGVFNPVGIREAETAILTESIIDALSVVVLGFPNTTASYGANGFTADHRATLLRAKTKRVYCAYDADPAGDHAADQLAHDLANHAIEVFRVELPCKDPNDFLKDGGTKDQFQALLDKAAVIPVSGAKPNQTTAPTPSPEDVASEEPETTAAATSWNLELVLGDRTYSVETPPVRTPLTLIVLLRVTRQERTHVDKVNLYLDRDRARFIGRAYIAFRGQVPKKVLEEDFFAVFDEVDKQIQPAQEEKQVPSPSPLMSPADRDEALAFLGRPDLIILIIDDITNLGVVGEEDTKLLVYLVATSRKLAKPLSLSVISRASAGKSWVLNRVGDLMPPEDILRYTRVSPRALFYDEPGRYKHKILFIEEAIGAKDADLGLRSMQSERRLSNLATMTDPKTGKLKTQENVVEGPLTYLTSSVEPLDHETATRGFEVAIDESSKQTARVVAKQFEERTLTGIQQKLTSEAIMHRHRNAQRLIEPLLVVNPYAKELTFPTDTLRLRREAEKYLSLIDAVALLHQHQRPVKTFTHEGTTHRYVEVEPPDINIANRLMVSCLARALSDLPGPAQELLVRIRKYVMARAEERGIDWQMVSFNRREIREAIRWSDYQVRVYLEMLADLEYIETTGGSVGKRYVYTLTPDHQLVVQSGLSLEEKIEAMGLTPSRCLATQSGSDLATKVPTSRRKHSTSR